MGILSQEVERFRHEYPAARILDVRYEDLLQQPGLVFGSLIDFLHTTGPEGFSTRVSAAVRGTLRAGNSEKWRARLTPHEQRRFESVGGQWLDRYQYERVAPNATPPGALRLVVLDGRQSSQESERPGLLA